MYINEMNGTSIEDTFDEAALITLIQELQTFQRTERWKRLLSLKKWIHFDELFSSFWVSFSDKDEITTQTIRTSYDQLIAFAVQKVLMSCPERDAKARLIQPKLIRVLLSRGGYSDKRLGLIEDEILERLAEDDIFGVFPREINVMIRRDQDIARRERLLGGISNQELSIHIGIDYGQTDSAPPRIKGNTGRTFRGFDTSTVDITEQKTYRGCKEG